MNDLMIGTRVTVEPLEGFVRKETPDAGIACFAVQTDGTEQRAIRHV